jgi:thiamine-monophosphate kinase
MLPPAAAGSEAELLERIAAAAGAAAPAPAAVRVGIGDDAAVLCDGTVLAADMLVDGAHFRLGDRPPRELGRRAAAANLSDLAAMGAEPVCLLAALGLPPGFAGAEELAAGIASFGVPLAGGDLSRSPALVICIAAVGRSERPVLRSGGRPGDVLAVTGRLGAQAASGYLAPVAPRLAEGRALAAVATAMIDISDGIAADAARLAAASGTGATIELERLPRPPGVAAEVAATGGEDFELLAALPPAAAARPPVPVTTVGVLDAEPGVRFRDAAGLERPLAGYDHFRTA